MPTCEAPLDASIKEQQVARLHVVGVDLPAHQELLAHFARQGAAVAGEGPLDQTAAVEAAGVAAAVAIRHPPQVERRGQRQRAGRAVERRRNRDGAPRRGSVLRRSPRRRRLGDPGRLGRRPGGGRWGAWKRLRHRTARRASSRGQRGEQEDGATEVAHRRQLYQRKPLRSLAVMVARRLDSVSSLRSSSSLWSRRSS